MHAPRARRGVCSQPCCHSSGSAVAVRGRDLRPLSCTETEWSDPGYGSGRSGAGRYKGGYPPCNRAFSRDSQVPQGPGWPDQTRKRHTQRAYSGSKLTFPEIADQREARKSEFETEYVNEDPRVYSLLVLCTVCGMLLVTFAKSNRGPFRTDRKGGT